MDLGHAVTAYGIPEIRLWIFRNIRYFFDSSGYDSFNQYIYCVKSLHMFSCSPEEINILEYPECLCLSTNMLLSFFSLALTNFIFDLPTQTNIFS